MSSVDNLAHLVRLLPKVELHIHLEGSIRPDTLLELARRRRVSLPADDEDGLRKWFRFDNFEHFVEIYLTCCKCLRDPEDFQLVAEQFLTDQARQNVLYTEAHFTIGTHLTNGANGLEVAEALHETFCEAERKHGIRARLIPDIVRNAGVQRADQTLEWALDSRDLGVVALGLSGFEEIPNDEFREHFRVAAEEGLRRVAHAGEHQGPETIRAALDLCDAERIGHGIRVLEDPGLVERLRDEQIPLEVCPSSNICLNAVRDLGSHPFDELDAAGLQVTINSDDPPFFDTTLSDEYLRLARTFGYSIEKLAQLSRRAVRFAFTDDELQTWLQREFDQRFEELGIGVETSEVNAEN